MKKTKTFALLVVALVLIGTVLAYALLHYDIAVQYSIQSYLSPTYLKVNLGTMQNHLNNGKYSFNGTYGSFNTYNTLKVFNVTLTNEATLNNDFLNFSILLTWNGYGNTSVSLIDTKDSIALNGTGTLTYNISLVVNPNLNGTVVRTNLKCVTIQTQP